jgi:chemotaxis protein MotB
LFDSENPRNPINRRISIVVMTKDADAEAKLSDLPVLNVAEQPTAIPGEPAQAAEVESPVLVTPPVAAAH